MATTEVAPTAAVVASAGDHIPAASDTPAVKPAKVVKAKAPREKKTSSAKKPALHPPYLEMIKEAIASLKERTGSSQYAISKFLEDKHKAHLPANFKKLLLVQLRKLTAAGKLSKVKNSYKINSAKPASTAKPKSVSVKPKSTAGKLKKAAVKAKSTAVKPKSAAAKLKTAVKPNLKSAAGKPKGKPAATKPKKVAKPKTVAPKPNTAGRPAKVAKTSAKAAPGKKAAPVAAKKGVKKAPTVKRLHK